MNHNDWIAATGSPIVGAGAYFRRPMNPRLVAAAMGKNTPARRTAAPNTSNSGAAARRRQIYLAAKAGQAPAPTRTPAQRRRAYEIATLGQPPTPRMKLSAAARGTSFAIEYSARQREAVLRHHHGR